ncbi:MAG: hypothetical protein V3U48_03800 [Rhodospirillales bacterium]
MADLLVYENYAYLNDDDRQRPGFVNGMPPQLFTYSNLPPEELWRVEGQNGSMLTADFQAALDAFQMGGSQMAKIEVIVFED